MQNGEGFNSSSRESLNENEKEKENNSYDGGLFGGNMVSKRSTEQESFGRDASSAFRISNLSTAQHELIHDLSDYTKRIETASQTQHGHAALIATLQSEVLAYQKRCRELEDRLLAETTTRLNLSDEDVVINGHSGLFHPTTSTPMKNLDRDNPDGRSPSGNTHSFLNTSETDVLTALEAEKQRVVNQKELNSMLREQLEASGKVNESMMTDVHRIELENERLKRDMRIKEEKWKERDKALKSHFTEEHRQLLSLWSALQTLKHQQIDLRSATERDMATLKTDFHRTYKQLVGACKSLGISQLAQSLLECGENGPSMDWLMKVDASGSMDPVLAEKLKKLVDSQREITATKNRLAERNEKLTADTERLEDEISRRDTEIESLKEECQRCKRDSRSLEERMRKLVKTAEQKQSELQKKNESLNYALNESQTRFEKCSEEITEKASELERSNQLVQSLEREKIVLQSEKDDFERRISAMTKRVSDLSVESNTVKSEKNSMEETLKRAQDEVRSVKSQYSTVESKLRDSESEKQKWKSDVEWKLSEKEKELDAERQRSLVAIQTLETEKKRLETESTNLWAKLESTEESRRSMERKILNLQSELSDSKEETKSAQERARIAQNLVVTHEETCKGHTEELKTWKYKLSQTESQYRTKDSQIKELNEKLRTIKSDRDALESECGRLKDAEEGFEREKVNYESAARVQESEIQNLRVLISELRHKKQDVESRLSRTMEEVKQKEQQESTLKSSVDRLKSALSRSEETEQRLRVQLEIVNTRSESEQKQWKEDVETTRRMLEEKSTICQQLQKDLEAAKESNNEWQKRYEAANSRLVNSDRDLGNSKQEKIRLDTELASLLKSLRTMELSDEELRKQVSGLEAESKESKARERQLQRQMEKLLAQKSEWTQKQERWEREKSSLYLTIEGLEEENQKAEASFRETADERLALHKSLETLERENIALHKELQKLKMQIAQLETGHTKKFVESVKQTRVLHEQQIEKIKSENREARISLEHYRSKCKGLEEQLRVAKEQLYEENKKVQNFCDNAFRHNQEVADIRTDMNRSIQNSSLNLLDSLLPVPGRRSGNASPFVTPIKHK